MHQNFMLDKLPENHAAWPFYLACQHSCARRDSGDRPVHSPHTVEDKVHQGGHAEVADLCRAFHDYQAEWTEDRITFLVDNRPYYAYDKPANADARNCRSTSPNI